MSGLEVAGLALGVFPLVLKAISGYADGCQKLSGMYHHEAVLKSFKFDLDTEYTKFLNTCEGLLQDLVSPDDLHQLLSPTSKEQGEALWTSLELQFALREHLRDRTVFTFIQNVQTMGQVLDELYRTFPVCHDSKKPFSSKHVKRVLKHLKFVALSSIYTEKINSVRQINENLETLALRGGYTDTYTTVGSKSQAAKAIQFYQRVREQASNLLGILKEKLDPTACGCNASHDATLQLEIRDINTHTNALERRKVGNGQKQQLRFRTFISLKGREEDGTWRGLDVEPVENPADSAVALTCNTTVSICVPPAMENCKDTGSASTPIPAERTRMRDFMRNGLKKKVGFALDNRDTPNSALQTGATTPTMAASPSTTSTLLLAPEIPTVSIICIQLRPLATTPLHPCFYLTSTLTPLMRHRVWTVPFESTAHQSSPETTSLRALLKSNYTLTLKQRIQLGVTLASSILQLHSSGWMSAAWGAEDIVFLKSPNGCMIENPLVHMGQQRPSGAGIQRIAHLPPDCNPTLLSLGILLIELHYGQCLEDCPAQTAGDQGDHTAAQPNSDTERTYDTLVRLARSLRDNSTLEYEGAVRRCVKGLDHREDTLDSEEFRRAVYLEVVCPLKNTLENLFIRAG